MLRLIYTSWIEGGTNVPQHIFKSTTGGGTNTNDWEDIGSPSEDKWINSIAIDNSNPDQIYVAAGQYVYKVNTINKVWTDISNNLPGWLGVKKLEIIPGTQTTIYAGTSHGIYYYTSQSGEWKYIQSNLPHAEISDMHIDVDNSRIAVGTFGRGVWEADLPCIENTSMNIIDNDETWDSEVFNVGTIKVTTGNTLTLVNATFWFAKDAKIIVETGARLILDGCTLTNACSDGWKGIEVWGSKYHTQNAWGGNGIPTYQGLVKVINGATISDAEVAIMASKRNSSGTYSNHYGGGIILADGGVFINNHIAIWIGNYKNHVSDVLNSPNYQRYNHSTIKNCLFETNNNFLEQMQFESFISLLKGSGITILGNEFKNLATNVPVQSLGTGISSIDFPIDVRSICNNPDQVPCAKDNNVFEGLFYGIEVHDNEPWVVNSIKNCRFTDCRRGIKLVNTHSAVVLLDTFEIPTTYK